jgi:hypothetical protein
VANVQDEQGQSENQPSVTIGTAGDRLTISVERRMHPGHGDFWDGNWLISPVTIVVGGFTGRISAGLRSEELVSFRAGLEAIHDSLTGEAKLDSLEGWVTLTLTGDGAGHVSVDGAVNDRPGMGNELRFRLELDQTYLPEIIDDLRRIESAFPVLDQPR